MDSTTSATSVLLVLSAFFVAAAVTAACRIKIATGLAGLLTLLTALARDISALLTPLATSRTIILRITSRRMLATTFASTLFHTLISVSVVCHIDPPVLVCCLNCQAVEVRPFALVVSIVMPDANVVECSAAPCRNVGGEHSNDTSEHKSRTDKQKADGTKQAAGITVARRLNVSA